ncbi:MAG: phosphoglycerate kinase [Candidatus Liptonbacteria bacterium]|nr:phosphoglycerate kinase [Candidatus Liptonbacteria bacterium]
MIRYLSKVGKKRLGSTAVVRLDFNTEDTWRMETAIPTLKFLLKRKCKVLALSHRGRPKGFEKKFSLRKDSQKLARLLGKKISFIPHFRFGDIKKILDQANPGSVFVLENIRFLKGEYQNSRELAKKLAHLGDFYVNEGFPISHRNDTSVAAITEFLPSYAGFQLEREIKYLSHVVANPKKPTLIVLGGGKAGDKLGILKFFRKKADRFIVGGEPANTLLWIKGVDIGDSLAEKDNRKAFLPLLKYKKLVLPIDYHIKNKRILDIGPRTEKLFAAEISKARTVIWNGPMGLFEKKGFERGSLAVARAIVSNKKCFSLAGGGETVMFLREYGFFNKFGFVSTGGGAMLEFLAGEKLPGIEALEKSKK